MNKLFQQTLPNGMRFYGMPLPGTQAATIFTVFQVGSRYEHPSVAGISHFLEHMMFKGTKKRPNAKDVARELDGMGAEYNAFTSKDWTGYYIKSAKNHFDNAFEIMSDMLLHSKLETSQVKRERHVILEEIRMYHDNPLMHIEDLFESRVFGSTPLGRDIAGSKKSVLGMTRKNLVNYWDQYYHPRNMVVVIAGAVDVKKAFAHTKTHFSHLKSKRRVPYFSCKFHQLDPQVTLVKKKTEQTQIALGFPGLGYDHPRLPALEVLHGIMGSGMSSRLFEEIREQLGLAYTVRTGITSYEDIGAFYVRAGLDPSKTAKAISRIIKELNRVKSQLVTLEELQRAKQYLNGSLALELEESDSYASWIAKQALFLPKVETVEQLQAKIAKVTREDVRNVARELFIPAKINLAMIGPFSSERPFAKLLREMR
jgi:predicted Zn-dependent peptidase